MSSKRLIICGGLLVLLCSCGEPQDPAGPERVVGATAVEAPVQRGVSDPGILQDPRSYQAAEGPTPAPAAAARREGGRSSGGATPAAGETATASGGAAAQVATLAQDLLALLQDGEVERVLRLFNDEHVGVLGDDELDVFYTTLDKVRRLRNVLEEKFEAEQAAQLMQHLRGTAGEELSWEVLDAEHASVSPNLVKLLFGPVKQTPNMVLVRQDGDWRFQLEGPLTREDADAIIVFQQKLQWALDRITQWLEGREAPPELALEEAFAAALAGEELDLEGVGESDTNVGEERPAQETERRGGRGRSRRRGG